MRGLRSAVLPAAAILGWLNCNLVATAQSQEFYRGKTVEVIVSTGTGGGLDANARLLARHWPKHIPGQPGMVVKNMPGAGHLRAANYLANQAPKDGTSVGAILPAFVLAELLEASKAVQFKSAKLSWIGSTVSNNSTIYVWRTAPVQTMQDVRSQEVLMGGTGAGSGTQIYPTILNATIGTKFKVIAGYATANDINIAMERGEVQGRAGNNFNSIRMETPNWLSNGSIRFLAQIGLKHDRDFPHIPLIQELADNEADRQVLQLFSEEVALGRPFLAPPDIPASILTALRRSFDKTVEDPAFLKDASAAHIDLAPMNGEELEKIVQEIMDTPANVIERARNIISHGSK